MNANLPVPSKINVSVPCQNSSPVLLHRGVREFALFTPPLRYKQYTVVMTIMNHLS